MFSYKKAYHIHFFLFYLADVSTKVKFGMPDLRTIAAICALVIITGLVIISLAL